MRDRRTVSAVGSRLGIGAVTLAAALSTNPAIPEAAGSGTLHLAGRVFERGTVWLSQMSLSFSSFNALSSASALTSKIVGTGEVWLTDLGISGNGSKFTVSVLSENAEGGKQPSLVDQDTGATVPYRLTYGGTALKFVGGEAQLADVESPTAPSDRAQPLALAVPPGTDVANGRFEEQLVVVVKAR